MQPGGIFNSEYGSALGTSLGGLAVARPVGRRRRGMHGLGATDCSKCDSLFGSIDWANCYAACAGGATGPAPKKASCQENCGKQDPTGGPAYMQCLANCAGGGTTQPTTPTNKCGEGGVVDIFTGIFGGKSGCTGGTTQPNTTQPNTNPPGILTTITDWFKGGGGEGTQPTVPQIVTPALSNCNSDCNKRFAQFSADWMQCNAGCLAANLPQPTQPGTQPGTTQPGGGLTDLFTGFTNLLKNLGGGAANVVPGVGPTPDGGNVPGTTQPVKAGMGVAGWAIIIGAVGVGGYLLLRKKKTKKPGEGSEVKANRRRGGRKHKVRKHHKAKRAHRPVRRHRRKH